MGGGEEGGDKEGEVQGPSRSIGALRELQVEILASEDRMQCLCNIRTWRGHFRGHCEVQASLGKIFEL